MKTIAIVLIYMTIYSQGFPATPSDSNRLWEWAARHDAAVTRFASVFKGAAGTAFRLRPEAQFETQTGLRTAPAELLAVAHDLQEIGLRFAYVDANLNVLLFVTEENRGSNSPNSQKGIAVFETAEVFGGASQVSLKWNDGTAVELKRVKGAMFTFVRQFEGALPE